MAGAVSPHASPGSVVVRAGESRWSGASGVSLYSSLLLPSVLCANRATQGHWGSPSTLPYPYSDRWAWEQCSGLPPARRAGDPRSGSFSVSILSKFLQRFLCLNIQMHSGPVFILAPSFNW